MPAKLIKSPGKHDSMLAQLSQYLINDQVHLPLHFVRTLCNEEALGVGLYFGAPGIYRYLAIHPLLHAFNLDRQKQELQFCETQPNRPDGKIVD